MSETVSDVAVTPSAAGKASDGFATITSLNDGFLGTGSSSLAELSYVAMVLIGGYVAYSTFRYFWPDFSVTRLVDDTLGLRD